jgi:hypothetical protein
MSVKTVRTGVLRQTGSTNGVRNFPLDDRLVQVKARRRTPARISTDPRARKHELSRPVQHRNQANLQSPWCHIADSAKTGRAAPFSIFYMGDGVL